MNQYDAIIVGSGAGGGPVAWQLTEAGKKIAIIEAGGFYTTDDFNRFELAQLRKLWWKARWTSNHELGLKDEIALGMGRCVGGSTTIFTAVAARAPRWNFEEWFDETGIVNDQGLPFSEEDISPYYDQVERDTSVRKYTEWDPGLKKIDSGFQKIGHPFSPIGAFVTIQCDQSGCLFGCPTEAKRGTLVSYVVPSVLMGAEIYYNSTVTKILFSQEKQANGDQRPSAEGVEFLDESGARRKLFSKIVILAAGAMNTPMLLLDSGIEKVAPSSKSVEQIGRNFGVNTGALVFGRYDDVLENWLIHPLSGHMADYYQKEKGGFLLEASSILEGPLGFAEFILDSDGIPMWGRKHKEVMKNYKHFAGIFINIHDGNDGRIFRDENGREKIYKPVSSEDLIRFEKARALCREGMYASGAKECFDTGYLSHHVQGTCRMGEDTARSVVNSKCELHDVKDLYIADGSLLPSVIDVNPSLTIMALSRRLGDHLLKHVLN